MKPSEIMALVDSVGFKHTRKLGQHFLLDETLLEAIAAAGSVCEQDLVLEVGTGAGTLTAVLARRAGQVVTVEVDTRLRKVVQRVLGEPSNVTHVEGDILDGPTGIHPDVEALLEKGAAAGLRVKCVSNFPYAIATPFVVRLLERALIEQAFPLALIAATVQLEVADRWRARAIGKAYGAPSALIQALAQVELDRKIGKRAFWPPPKVESAVVVISPHPEAEQPPTAEWSCYRDLVRAAFQYRRKTIRNALMLGLKKSAAAVDQALEAAGVEPAVRVERLSVERLQTLARALNQTHS